jgi:hypothetical protein
VDSHIPVKSMLGLSKASLQELSLSRLNNVREIDKQMRTLEELRADELATAKLAALLMEDARLSSIGGHASQEAFDFVSSAGPKASAVDATTNRFVRNAAD